MIKFEFEIKKQRYMNVNKEAYSMYAGKESDLQWIDRDHVWIAGNQYISLQRVGQMIEESKQNRKTGNISIGISVDTTELDETLEKFREIEQIYDKVMR
jgi:hypothetical protein